MPAQTQQLGTPLPARLGVAADLVFIVGSPAAYLLNCLLVYEQVVVPINGMVLQRLLVDFPPALLKRLCDQGRMIFCPSATGSLALRKEPAVFTRNGFLQEIESSTVWHPTEDPRQVVGMLDANLLTGDFGDFNPWLSAHDRAVAEFMRMAERDGYQELLPPNSLFSNRLDRLVGLRTGMARMNDLVVAGVSDLQLDGELPVLLEVCFPRMPATTLVSPDTRESDAVAAIERLHSIKGLPALELGFAAQLSEVDAMIKLVLSDEAAYLREWLRKHWSAGLDVRESYAASERLLPSKKNWVGWMRYGVVTGVSTVVGALLDPVSGAAAGAAIGAADYKLGTSLVEKVCDPYHPSKWLSYFENKLPRS